MTTTLWRVDSRPPGQTEWVIEGWFAAEENARKYARTLEENLGLATRVVIDHPAEAG